MTHQITVGSVIRQLPLIQIPDGPTIAALDVLGDWELLEEAGRILAPQVPENVSALIMPDGKAQALLHVLGRITKLPTIVARKKCMVYMEEPILSSLANSITSGGKLFYLDAKVTRQIRGKRVLIVDDVVSTGGTLAAVRELLVKAEAHEAGVMAMFTEGTERPDVISLGHLPLFEAP